MSATDLNFDNLKMDDAILGLNAFHHVMALSTRDTVSRVMRTCHALNHEGARYILSRDPTLSQEWQVTSFLCFLDARGQATVTAGRLYWLEGLRISSFSDEEAFASDLKTFFTRFAPLATHFVRLSIDQDEGESLLSADPELPLAIAALTTLRTLKLAQAGNHSMTMLRHMQSSLLHADIGFDTARTSDMMDEDPVAALANSQISLCTLSLGYTTVAPSPDPPCYPFLYKLSLSYVDLPTTWHLIQAFPNVSTIRTSDIALCVHFGDLNETQDEARRRQRLRNIDDQQRYRSWTSLSSFKGSLSMLFVLGLTCHVPYVDVGSDDDPDERFDLDMLHAVVIDTRPTKLTLRIDVPSHIPLPALESGLLSVCSGPAFQFVEMCKVCIAMYPGDRNYNVGAMLDALCGALASSCLDTFKLRIDWTFLARPLFRIPQTLRRQQRREPESPSLALAYLEDLDAEELAYRLLDAIPSIETVKVELVRDHHDRQSVELERESSAEYDEADSSGYDDPEGPFDSEEESSS